MSPLYPDLPWVRLNLLPERAPLLDHMLHISAFGSVQFDVVLGQDLHDRPDLQPPLCLWDAMPAADRQRESNSPLHLILLSNIPHEKYVLLKICVFFQVSERLKGERPLPHAQHTGRVWCVSKDAT